MPTKAWWQDFHYENGIVHVKKTGIDVPVERGVVGETATWLVFHAAIEAARLGVRRDGPRVWFAPDRPRPWYLLWPVFQLAGLRFAARPEEADLAFVFEDATQGVPPALPGGLPVLNTACVDVSKSRVAAVFEQVFGYPLGVDPETFAGPMVKKSEANGVHDGVVMKGPAPRVPGYVYQRLVDTLASDGLVEDLRCPTVDGQIPVVFIKRREPARRFANANAEVRMVRPDTVFTEDERANLSQFCRAMKLDWGGLDVLRDRDSGALYVVDVNKTDMGPPIALPLNRKMEAARTLARALRAFADRLACEVPAS